MVRFGTCCDVVATTKKLFFYFTANPGHHFFACFGDFSYENLFGLLKDIFSSTWTVTQLATPFV